MASKKPAARSTTAAQLLVTSGAALRKVREEGVVLTFPSGNNYRVTLPSPGTLLRRGHLPNPLLSFVVDAFYNGVTVAKYEAFVATKERQEDALAMLDSLRVVCQAMLMQPKIVDEPQGDDEISIDDLPIMDQEWALRLLFAPVSEVLPFRGEQAADVVSVARPEDVPQAA